MRSRAIFVAIGLVSVAGVLLLADLTQNRVDPVAQGTRSRVSFDVELNGFMGDRPEAARALWGVCAGTIDNAEQPPGLRSVGGHRFEVQVAPALGEHSRDRLRGCLRDLTVAQVRGGAVAIDAVTAPS